MTAADPALSSELAARLASASVEISSRGHQVPELRDHFAAGTDVTITFLPGDNYRRNVDTASALRRTGFNPVPHIAAREMPSREALDDFLRRARGEAEVRRILVIAGDVARQRGPFGSSRDICASGLIEARGIASVSVAGHPEGHPFLEAGDAFSVLEAWRDWKQTTGIGVDVMTQFCFESAPILAWIGELQARRLGLAGDRRSGRTRDGRDADEVCAPLRHRQFDALAARPDRPPQPAFDRYRAGRCHARLAVGAAGRDGADRRLPRVSVRRAAQGGELAAQLQRGDVGAAACGPATDSQNP